MTEEERLKGWLCFMRLNAKTGGRVPDKVRQLLTEKGWIVCKPSPGGHKVWITERGETVTDLAGPEWGVDPLGKWSK